MIHHPRPENPIDKPKTPPMSLRPTPRTRHKTRQNPRTTLATPQTPRKQRHSTLCYRNERDTGNGIETPSNPNSPLQQAARINLGSLSKIYIGGGEAADASIGATNSEVTFTARKGGTEGQTIRIRTVDPATANAALTVNVAGRDITINLATDGASAETSTATQVLDAVNTHPSASSLVVATLPGTSNGTGIVPASAFENLVGGVDAGPWNTRRINRSFTIPTFTDTLAVILTASERATWDDMQDFVGFNAGRLSANLAIQRTK